MQSLRQKENRRLKQEVFSFSFLRMLFEDGTSRLKVEERKVRISKSVVGLFGVLNSDAHVRYALFLKEFLQNAKLRTFFKKVLEVDPLLCPQCHHERKGRHGTGTMD